MSESEVSFLEPFVVHPALLYRYPGTDVPDIVKKVHEVMDIMRENPLILRPSGLERVTVEPECQHGKPEVFLGHSSRVGGLARDITRKLLDRHQDLDLPSPEVMYALGLVHDLSALYARYDDRFTQADKELTLFFQADHLDVPLVAESSAMHATYWEILEMIHDRTTFAGSELYSGWRDVLTTASHRYNYFGLEERFSGFLEGKDNLALIVVTVADLIENGKARFDPECMDSDFWIRTGDIIERYHVNKVNSGQLSTAFGMSLMRRRGLERVVGYKRLISGLLAGELDKYGPETRPGLWEI
jgi:hypothetical protein